MDPDSPPTRLLVQKSRAFVDMTPFMVARGVDFTASDLDVATCITITFRQQTHTVYVVDCPDGKPACWYERRWGRYIYKGKRYKTLTAIARFIVGKTDERINGNRFFGLRRRRRGL